MKKCCRCGEVKSNSQYFKNKRAADGLMYHCKTCHSKTTMQWQKDNPQRAYEINQKAQIKRREEKARTQREYYLKNKTYYIEKAKERQALGLNKKYKYKYDYCPEKARLNRIRYKATIKLHRLKRKALLRGSIIDFTKKDYERVLDAFGGKCALTDSTDIHMDHFIPVSTGYGDTVIGNMIPLDATLNLSKHASNPFEWIKERDDIDLKRFEDVVFYLAELNGFSPEEYEAHVYNCFD